MATLKVYQNGLSFGIGGGNSSPPKRGTVQGWTAATARRQRQWLYSVDTSELTGQGYAVTLTLRDCPETSDDWAAARNALFKRFRRIDLSGLHWVTEWQTRMVPHLHLAAYFPDSLPQGGWELTNAWLDLCKSLGWAAGFGSQDVKPIDGALGWLKYQSKHAGRSAAHYQRSGMPPGWEKSGRLWGVIGHWPTREPVEASLNREQFHRYRRLMRAYVLAAAKRDGDVRRVTFLKRAPARETDPVLNSVRGLSEFAPQNDAIRLLELLN